MSVVPSLVVVNVTIRALKHHGGCLEENINKFGLEYLTVGIKNLDMHIKNMQKFSDNVIVAINKFKNDDPLEIDFVIDHCKKNGVAAVLSNPYEDGGAGTINLAKLVIEYCNKPNKVRKLYQNSDSIEDKVATIVKEVYHAKNVVYSPDVLKKIPGIDKYKYPVCIAKTPLSITDNPKLIGVPTDYLMTVTDAYLENGAGLIVVLMGNILTMPGLGKNNAYQRMQIDDYGNVRRLF